MRKDPNITAHGRAVFPNKDRTRQREREMDRGRTETERESKARMHPTPCPPTTPNPPPFYGNHFSSEHVDGSLINSHPLEVENGVGKGR